MQHLTERSRSDKLPERGDGRCPAEREADPHDGLSRAGGVGHRPSIVQRVAERLLAQHMFAGGNEALHHFAVQGVGYDHADDVDLWILRDGPPRGVVDRSYPKRRAASEPNSGLTSPMETYLNGGKVDWYSVGAIRYAAACARPAMPAPMTAIPIVIDLSSMSMFAPRELPVLESLLTSMVPNALKHAHQPGGRDGPKLRSRDPRRMARSGQSGDASDGDPCDPAPLLCMTPPASLRKPLAVSIATRENVAVGETAVEAEIQISLLGGFSVAVAGKPIEEHWRLRKAKTLVKLLALAPGHWLTRDVVIEILWADAEPQAASNNLHQILHSIRRVMGAESIALDDDVRLGPAGGVTVDVDLFERAVATARRSNDVAALNEALALWAGPLLPEDQYADWAMGHRERLAETHDAVTTLLASRLSEQGELEAALALLEPLASTRPLDEPLHRALIHTLPASVDAEAIEVYERLRTGLDEAYAVEPEPETKALYRRLLSAGQAMPGTIPHNLPESTTSFIGRRRLLTELSAGLGRTRLLTLTGVGGVGKSRLALELARRAASTEFPDGVWLVELAGIQDPEIVASMVASSLRLTLPGGPNPTVTLAEQLASRKLLLIMDNCEHLLDACSDLVHEVLTRCPEINVVTTSRSRSQSQASWSIGCRHWSCRSSELILIIASCSGWKPSSCSWSAPG